MKAGFRINLPSTLAFMKQSLLASRLKNTSNGLLCNLGKLHLPVLSKDMKALVGVNAAVLAGLGNAV